MVIFWILGRYFLCCEIFCLQVVLSHPVFFLRHERQQRVVDPMCICSAMIMVQLNFSMENKIFKVNSGKVSDSSIALVFDIELILYKKGLCLSSRKSWLEESTWNEIFENDTLVSCETQTFRCSDWWTLRMIYQRYLQFYISSKLVSHAIFQYLMHPSVCLFYKNLFSLVPQDYQIMFWL